MSDLTTLHMSRRALLRTSGVLGGAGAIVGLGPLTHLVMGTANAATTPDAVADCTMIEAGEIGPFFVDGQLERSDVRTNSATATRVSRTRRHVTVKFNAGEKVTTKAVLVHGTRVVAQTAPKADAKGNHTVVIAINNSVAHGSGEVYLACKDAAGNYQNLTHKAQLPR